MRKYFYTFGLFFLLVFVSSAGFDQAFGYGGGGGGGGSVSAPQSSAGGGGGGGGGVFIPAITPTPSLPEDDSPEGQVLGASTFNFSINLRRTDFNRDVTELQKRLMKEGYFIGPITGYFGPITFAATQSYQSAHGIPSTGFVGPLTRGALNATSI